MRTFKLEMLGIPRPKQSFRFAVRKNKIGKTYVQKYQDQDVIYMEQSLAWQVAQQLPKDFKPFDCGIMLRIEFIFPPLKSWTKKQKQALADGEHIFKITAPDIDNLQKMVCDAMEGVVYVNDSRICKKTVEKCYGEQAKTRIVICALDEET